MTPAQSAEPAVQSRPEIRVTVPIFRTEAGTVFVPCEVPLAGLAYRPRALTPLDKTKLGHPIRIHARRRAEDNRAAATGLRWKELHVRRALSRAGKRDRTIEDAFAVEYHAPTGELERFARHALNVKTAAHAAARRGMAEQIRDMILESGETAFGLKRMAPEFMIGETLRLYAARNGRPEKIGSALAVTFQFGGLTFVAFPGFEGVSYVPGRSTRLDVSLHVLGFDPELNRRAPSAAFHDPASLGAILRRFRPMTAPELNTAALDPFAYLLE